MISTKNFVVKSSQLGDHIARAVLLLRDLTEEMGGRGLRFPHLGRGELGEAGL